MYSHFHRARNHSRDFFVVFQQRFSNTLHNVENVIILFKFQATLVILIALLVTADTVLHGISSVTVKRTVHKAKMKTIVVRGTTLPYIYLQEDIYVSYIRTHATFFFQKQNSCHNLTYFVQLFVEFGLFTSLVVEYLITLVQRNLGSKHSSFIIIHRTTELVMQLCSQLFKSLFVYSMC